MSYRRTHNRTLLLFFFAFFCFTVTNFTYANMSINDAVNAAGKQRMLTQRMLKNYAMIGMGNSYGSPDKNLKQNIELFDKTLSKLKAMHINAEVDKSLTNIGQLWGGVKPTIQSAPEKEKVIQLQKDLDTLLTACHEATELIAKSAGVKGSKIINISGRQRMLSQRLASLYMLQVWGVKDPEFKTKLSNAMDEFSKAHTTLSSSQLNSPEIKTGLKKVKKLFMWFEVMGRSKSGKYVPAIISKSADKILEEMNTITSLYVKAI